MTQTPVGRKRRTRRPRSPGRRRPPLGQHFLVAPHIRSRILEGLNPRSDDCWLEIGGGHGEMTLGLSKASQRITAVEKDEKLADALGRQLAPFPLARVVQGDILRLSLPKLIGEMGCAKARVYGNLPYYIASAILQQLFRSTEVITDIHVVVQREVAERLVAQPGGRDYGYLSVLAQFHSRPEIVLSIPALAFRPPPQVASALVQLALPSRPSPPHVKDPETFLRFVGFCFRQKRKTVLNNLRGLYDARTIETALAKAGFERRVRAEELSLENFAELLRHLA